MVDSRPDETMVSGDGHLSNRIDSLERKFDGLVVSLDVRFDQVGAAIAEQRAYTEFAYERLNQKVDAGFARIDLRFGEVDSRFDRIDARFAEYDDHFIRIDARFDQMDARLDQMDARLDQMDARLDQMDARLDRLERKLDQLIDHLIH